MHLTPSNLATAKPVDIAPIMHHAEIRRAAACQSFWSNDRLNLAFRQQHGTDTFSLKEFVAFVIAMPSGQFLSLAFEALDAEGVR